MYTIAHIKVNYPYMYVIPSEQRKVKDTVTIYI